MGDGERRFLWVVVVMARSMVLGKGEGGRRCGQQGPAEAQSSPAHLRPGPMKPQARAPGCSILKFKKNYILVLHTHGNKKVAQRS